MTRRRTRAAVPVVLPAANAPPVGGRPRRGRRSGTPGAFARELPAPQYSVAVLGGTFDHLHAGHRALIAAAFRRATEVRIGLTTDRFARSERKPRGREIEGYAARSRHLRRYLHRAFRDRRWSVVPLDDPWGGSVGPGVDLLVISEETGRAARPINDERARRGLPPLAVVQVPLVRAEDERPISSRRIRAGEIDAEGRLRHLSPGLERRPTKH